MSDYIKIRLNPNIRIKHLVLFFFVYVFCLNIASGQQRVRDSLREEMEKLRAAKNFNASDSLHIDILNHLGVQMRFYKPDSLLILSHEALKQSRLFSYHKGEIQALFGIGDYYSGQGNYEKSVLHYQEALKKAESIENTDLILDAENGLAGEYEYQGHFELALRELLKGVEIAKGVENSRMLSVFNENIALLYAAQNDNEEALNYLKIAKKLNKETNDELNSARTLSNLASIYADAENYEHAMFNANSCISTFEEYRVMDWLAYAYETKGKIYLKQLNYKWALYWYKQSQMLHNKSVDDERGEIDLLLGLSEVYLGIHKDSIAETYANMSYAASSRLHVKEGMKNASEILYKIYKKKGNASEALIYHELFHSLSDSLAKNESKKSLLMLKTKVNHEKQKEHLIVQNHLALAKQKKYITGILGLLGALILIVFLIKRSEKIQKNLNKELKVKQSELEEHEKELMSINQTKDKLFSIIGHDLRGPIGAFQGLLQLFNKGEVDQKEFLSFIPKLKTDIDQISFTLNNLLSWGQTQMNGTITKPSVVDIENIAADNIKLLSEIALSKSIQLVNNIGENTLVWSDPDQIDIVIRNLISNALKFTKKNGLVSVHALEKNEYWEISVQDTGVGMTEETQDQIFSDNSNVTTYGTDNEKGTGLGLTLCKEMIENNKGEIWVNSTLNQGTCFKFTLPKAKKSYGQAS